MSREEGRQFCRYCRGTFKTHVWPPTNRARLPALSVQNSLDPKLTAKVKLLEQQLVKEPTRVSALLELAECYLTTGRAEQAVQLLEGAPALQNKMALFCFLLGKTQESVGAYDSALDAYLAALQDAVWNPEVEDALFQENFLSKTYPRSVEQLSEVAAKRKDVLLWRLLARVCEVNTDYDQSTAFLTEALRVKPDDVASMSILARLFERRSQIEEAEKWHRHILEVNPMIGVSNLFLAQCHYTRGDYAEAIPYFERLLLKEPTNRIYKLYWLFANIRCHGVHDLEAHLAKIQQWHDLTAEQQQLGRDLFLAAGKESLLEGRLAQAEQYLLQANHFAPSPQIDQLLRIVAEKQASQSQRVRQDHQLPVRAREKIDYDPWIAMCEMILQDERRRKRQRMKKRIVAGVRLGLAITLIAGGILGYSKVREWIHFYSTQNEELPRVEQVLRGDSRQATEPAEILTSETWAAVKEPSAHPLDEETQDSSPSHKAIRKKSGRGL